MAKLPDFTVGLRADSRKLRQDLARSQRHWRNFTRRNITLLRNWSRLATRSIAVVSTALTALVGKTAGYARETRNLAARAGLGVKQFQDLANAFTLFGADAETASEVVKELNVRLGDAQNGSQGVISAFREIGLSVRDLENLDGSERLLEVLEALSQVPSPQRRAFLADELLGGTAAERIGPILKEFDAFQEALKNFTKLFSDESALIRAAKFADAILAGFRLVSQGFIDGFSFNFDFTKQFDVFNLIYRETRKVGNLLRRISEYILDNTKQIVNAIVITAALNVGAGLAGNLFAGTIGTVAGIRAIRGARRQGFRLRDESASLSRQRDKLGEGDFLERNTLNKRIDALNASRGRFEILERDLLQKSNALTRIFAGGGLFGGLAGTSAKGLLGITAGFTALLGVVGTVTAGITSLGIEIFKLSKIRIDNDFWFRGFDSTFSSFQVATDNYFDYLDRKLQEFDTNWQALWSTTRLIFRDLGYILLQSLVNATNSFIDYVDILPGIYKIVGAKTAEFFLEAFVNFPTFIANSLIAGLNAVRRLFYDFRNEVSFETESFIPGTDAFRVRRLERRRSREQGTLEDAVSVLADPDSTDRQRRIARVRRQEANRNIADLTNEINQLRLVMQDNFQEPFVPLAGVDVPTLNVDLLGGRSFEDVIEENRLGLPRIPDLTPPTFPGQTYGQPITEVILPNDPRVTGQFDGQLGGKVNVNFDRDTPPTPDPSNYGERLARSFYEKLRNDVSEALQEGDFRRVGKILVRNVRQTFIQSMADGLATSFTDSVRKLFNHFFRSVFSLEGRTPGGGGLGAFLSGIFGGTSGRGLDFPEFHRGGVVGGVRGSEQLILAQAGEVVLTPKQQANLMGRLGSATQVNIYNENNSDVTATESYVDGEKQIDVIVRGSLSRQASYGGLDALQGSYGGARSLIGRT